MSWRLKLSNWLSQGKLEKYQQQARHAEAKLHQIELQIESLRAREPEYQKELAQTKAQLQISRGFQIELGQTQVKLKEALTVGERYKQKLLAVQQELERAKVNLRSTSTELAKSQDWLQQIKTPIEVIDVKKILPKHEFDTLWGFGLGVPRVNTMATAGSLDVKGWVLGKRAKATLVKMIYQGETLLEMPVDRPRPTVIQQYPDIAAAGDSGFESSFSVAGLDTETELELHAVLADETVIPLCAIVIKPHLESDSEFNINETAVDKTSN